MNKPTKAVIYARVSGAKQVRDGDGLASQESRCREYATYKDYDVIEVFTDDMTGKALRRPAMDRMLAFLRLHKKDSIAVIIDDISRLARNIEAHIELRRTLSDAGGILESPSIEFGEDSDSRLVEHMLATVAQHQREKNAEQTQNRMRGRKMNGYWTFQAPIGFRYEKINGHGKLLVRNEPVASIVQEGLEGYATGRFASQAELKRFFESQPAFPKDLPNDLIRQQRVSEMLTRIIYAGYVEYEPWGVTRRKGQHDGLVSLETWEQIQDRSKARKLAPARTDLNEDFPLRGAVICADCEAPLTSCWSKSGTGKRYPYYWCKSRTCASYRKNIRAERIDAGFADLMQHMTPSRNLLSLASRMLKDAWSQRDAQFGAKKSQIRRDISACNTQIESLLERIVEASNPTVIAAYEKKLANLEADRMRVEAKLTQNLKPAHSFDEMFELSKAFLSNPCKTWENAGLTLRKIILRLTFSAPLAYDRQSGFRTPQASVIFEFFEKITSKCKMVHLRGFEPLASAFGGQRSIQLSYRCV